MRKTSESPVVTQVRKGTKATFGNAADVGFVVLQEGNIIKGGVNPPSNTPRPNWTPSGQGIPQTANPPKGK